MIKKQTVIRFKETIAGNLVAVVIVGFALLSAGGWFAHARISAHDAAVRKAALSQQKQLSDDPASRLNKLESDDKGTTKSTDNTVTASASGAQRPAPSPIKYAISSDPRSTAYSLTPPTPNPASFLIKITHPGQVAAGTLISYNATKGDKTYYGGDLVLTPSTITISKSRYSNTDFTVALPDGGLNMGANLPWDESNQVGFVAFHGTGAPVPATSITQFVQLYSNTTPNGTYQIHMIGGPVNPPTSDGWECDGFLTVIVTD